MPKIPERTTFQAIRRFPSVCVSHEGVAQFGQLAPEAWLHECEDRLQKCVGLGDGSPIGRQLACHEMLQKLDRDTDLHIPIALWVGAANAAAVEIPACGCDRKSHLCAYFAAAIALEWATDLRIAQVRQVFGISFE